MQAKERERAEVAAQKRREALRQAQEKREAFEKRIARTRERAAEAELERRREFEAREMAAQQRAEALEAARREEVLLRQQIEEEKEAQRAAVVAEAAAAEQLRKSELLEKRRRFEERERELQRQKEAEAAERARRIEQAEEERRQKLDKLLRWRDGETAKLGQKIDAAMHRSDVLNQQKRELVASRKVSAVRAQIARQQMKDEMEAARRRRWAAQHPGSPFELLQKAKNRPVGVSSAPTSPMVSCFLRLREAFSFQSPDACGRCAGEGKRRAWLTRRRSLSPAAEGEERGGGDGRHPRGRGGQGLRGDHRRGRRGAVAAGRLARAPPRWRRRRRLVRPGRCSEDAGAHPHGGAAPAADDAPTCTVAAPSAAAADAARFTSEAAAGRRVVLLLL